MNFSPESIADDLSNLNIAILRLLESDSKKPVVGKTAFQKEMFLIGNFIDSIGEDAEFIPHLFGPYSEASEISLNDLISLGLAKRDEKNNYIITDTGSRILKIIKKRFTDDQIESINDFKQFIGKMTVDEILLFICASYPSYTIESTAYQRIMKKRINGAISIYKKGLISLEKAAFLAGMNIESFIDTLKRT